MLILDEPTDGLDPGQKQETLGMLRELGRNHTIMLSSHLLTEVESIAQRVIILRRGHLGLAKKISELETDAVIVLEVRGLPIRCCTRCRRGRRDGSDQSKLRRRPECL